MRKIVCSSQFHSILRYIYHRPSTVVSRIEMIQGLLDPCLGDILLNRFIERLGFFQTAEMKSVKADTVTEMINTTR